MKLGQLIKENEVSRGEFDASIEIGTPRDDSRKVSRGDVFFSVDGAHIGDAVEAGAKAVVCGSGADCGKYIGVPNIYVDDVRRAYALACQRYRGCPGDKMKLIAVTGTNGKTSTTMILRSILEHAGHKTGLIGTIGNFIGKTRHDTSYTTPPPDVVAELLEEMRDDGVEYVVMEASSHALDQRRLDGLHFEVGIFTNLTRDHLDYHKSIEACAEAKARLFEMCGASVINLDDAHAKEMAWHAAGNVYYCSKIDAAAEFFADNAEVGMSHLGFSLHHAGGTTKISSSLTGGFYIYNVMFAAAAALLLGVDASAIAEAVAEFSRVDGRMETYKIGGATAVIDYAHTPDALEKALSTLRPLTCGKLTALFGCGGERDRGKRAMMGDVAAKYADVVILTSDNPRSEDPCAIIEEISRGVPKDKTLIKIPDRAEAIKTALRSLKSGDAVLIAGKGHEDYLIDADGKHHFSDREQVEMFTRKGN